MNKLLNVSRETGFPLCAETIEALNANVRYIEAIMDGFEIRNTTAIVLSGNNPAPISAASSEMIMYVKYNHIGSIACVYTDIPSNSTDYPNRERLLASNGEYSLEKIYDTIEIFKPNSTDKYEDCIVYEKYKIVKREGAWLFRNMKSYFNDNPDYTITQIIGNHITLPSNLTFNRGYVKSNRFLIATILKLRFTAKEDLSQSMVVGFPRNHFLSNFGYDLSDGIFSCIALEAGNTNAVKQIPVYFKNFIGNYGSYNLFLNFVNQGVSKESSIEVTGVFKKNVNQENTDFYTGNTIDNMIVGNLNI